MWNFAATMIYGGCLATMFGDIAKHEWGLNLWLATVVWIAAFALSFAPLVRTALCAYALSFFMPWWFAVPASMLVSVVRHVLATKDQRDANIKADMEKLRRYKESLREKEKIPGQD